MQIVILSDLVGSYLSTWVRLANTAGYDQIKPGDRFREQGFGEGCEELEVDGVDFSPVGGASRLHVIRAGNNTRVEVHRAGMVFEQIFNSRVPLEVAYQPLRERLANGSDAAAVSNQPENGISESVHVQSPEGREAPDLITAGGTQYANPAKRGRGRPPGSKNKPKPPLNVPAWPGMP